MRRQFESPTMLDVEAPLRSEALQEVATSLCATFRERSRVTDEAGEMPVASLRELFERGLLHVTIGRSLGGRSSNLLSDDPATFPQLLRLVARGCSGTAHCLAVHNHSIWMLEALGTPEQVERLLKPLAHRARLASGTASEPGRRAQNVFSTKARRVEGGFVLNGVKNYATNQPLADVSIIMASIDGIDDPLQNYIMLLVDPRDPAIRADDDWYRPTGMRTARSPLLRIDDLFVPDADVLGEPGDYPRQRWQGRVHLGFAANYLGTAEGMFDWFLAYTNERGDGRNAVLQLRTGEMRVALDAAVALFQAAIATWPSKPLAEAELISMSAKKFAAQTALEIAHKIIQACGSSAMFMASPLSRMVRDLQTHVPHAGHDRTAQIVGQAALGESFDSTLQR
ncbi:acyl-CoA dehydrogenase family protein [Bosea sp. RCC_152_1]|uniref:acyl-CoA dehydrogenase family protein n=1 Tax=Bosea sp. RCC_152_1 TaxID=3239228 RepID=UPI00352319E2